MNRIRFNGQDLFLSGGNIAWVDFARDIGPGTTQLPKFNLMFSQLHNTGGNAMRFWLHTTGANTPEWNGSQVVGPGVGAVDDLRDILDSAWDRGIGLVLCLWSFDMLRISNGATITDRAYGILTNPDLTQTYIDNALVPMVTALAGHPAIIAWEIFNEPEGMSVELGWDFNRHVPMADIQRFINITAGAIHRTDPGAQVTNGSWAFIASSDNTPGKTGPWPRPLTEQDLGRARVGLSARYDHSFSEVETQNYLNALAAQSNYNYYTDERLVAAGGDPDGTLDFYTVHYYEWGGTALSPFHHDVEVWGLTKPLAIAEFYLGGSSDSGGDGDPDATYGIPWRDLYPTLHERGYAGGLAWQWYNYPTSAEGVISWPRILESAQIMIDRFPQDVVVDQGLRIVHFRADPPQVEQGHPSELSWYVNGATSVTLDGNPVAASGTLSVSPSETSTYVLVATDANAAETLTRELTLTVLLPNEVNRAFSGNAFASTVEACCGATRLADLAFDGDKGSRWSSAWDPREADENPDDEWIYVDLGRAYDVERIVLNWNTAYGSAYDVDVSFDGVVWLTVHEERSGDGNIDEVVLPAPVSSRYVRMHGLNRATDRGFSLWEFEVYGLPSALQPPEIALSSPIDGLLLQTGAATSIQAVASDPDGQIVRVDFHVDGEPIGTATEPPYSVSWAGAIEGEYEVTALATDSDGIEATAHPIRVHVGEMGDISRYEAESASSEGPVTVRVNLGASRRFYAEVQPGGRLDFGNLPATTAGEYLLLFRYRLPDTVTESRHSIRVNGASAGDIRFTGEPGVWHQRVLTATFQTGPNALSIRNDVGSIDLDFLDVSTVALNVAKDLDNGASVPNEVVIAQNYPNPFHQKTRISYSVPAAVHVQLDVFDVTGRHIANLVDGLHAAGPYAATFDGRGLGSGVYVYRIRAGKHLRTRRMVLLE
jgi:hypothetical protein